MGKLFVVAACSFGLLFVILAPRAWAGDFVWQHVGKGGSPGTASLNGSVFALHADGNDLYVGGSFTEAGGVASADYIAKWNGSTWSGFAPLNGIVHAIAFAGGTLIVGGDFTNASGNPDVDFLARWNGSAWEPVCNAAGPAFNGSVNALQVIGNTLYVGGAFADGAGIASADRLLACDLTTGTASSTVDSVAHSLTGGIYALTADDSGTLYVGASITDVEANPAIDYLGAYDGSWHAMGSGGAGGGAINDYVRALASDGANVYVGTDAFDIFGIAQADHIAKWDGSVWRAMGGMGDGYFSTPTVINAITVFGPLVFAGGSFQNASGDPLADVIVYWDGSAWHPVGSNGAGNGPLSANALALATVGGRIFVGGTFTSAGGDTLASFIAQAPIAPIVVFIDGFEQN
jgi:hypothetical protein